MTFQPEGSKRSINGYYLSNCCTASKTLPTRFSASLVVGIDKLILILTQKLKKPERCNSQIKKKPHKGRRLTLHNLKMLQNKSTQDYPTGVRKCINYQAGTKCPETRHCVYGQLIFLGAKPPDEADVFKHIALQGLDSHF